MIDVGHHGDEPAVMLTGRHLAAVAALIDQANDQRRHRGAAPLPTLVEIADAIRSCSFERSVVAIGHTDGSRWVPAAEVARAWGVTPRAVQQRADRGALPARLIGRRWYIAASVLDQADTAALRPTRARRRPDDADTATGTPTAAPPASRRIRTVPIPITTRS